MQRNLHASRLLSVGVNTGAVVLACALALLAIERLPGRGMSHGVLSQLKGAVPHRTLGRAFLPHSMVRTTYPDNPRGYFEDAHPLRSFWRIAVYSGSSAAAATYRSDAPASIRVDLVQLRAEPPGSGGSVRLQSQVAPVVAGVPYRLSFRARSTAVRPITVTISQRYEPWRNLGYSRRFLIDTSWTAYSDVLTVAAGDTAALLHFNLAEDTTSVELAEMFLHEEGTQARVIPPKPAMYVVRHRFNSLGCRGGEVQAKRTDTVRILVLGDSYAIGMGVHERDMWSMRLQGHLNLPASGASPPPQYEVIACGVPGYGTRQARLLFESLADRLVPDLVVLTAHWNDGRLAVDEVPGGRTWWPPPASARRPPLFLSSVGSTPDGAYPRDLRLASLIDEMRRMQASADARGIRFSIAMLRADDDARWDQLRSALGQLDGTPIYDLGAYLTTRPGPRDVVHDVLDHHPNERVHEVIGRTMGEFVRIMKLVPSPTGSPGQPVPSPGR